MAARGLLRASALLLSAAVAVGQSGVGQDQAQPRFGETPSTAVETVLRQMTQAAGVIFAGEVIAVRRPAGFAGSPQNAAEGVITVEFRVDQAVRGCTGGSIYTLREWAGLWMGGDRYRAGQRLLVFLRSPNRGGLSSPVGGKAGVVPLRGGGQAPGPYDGDETSSEWLADLRWVQAQALRPDATNRESDSGPDRPVTPIRGRPNEATMGNGALMPDPFLPHDPIAHWATLPPSGEPATQPLAQLLGMCRGWMRTSDGAL